MAYGSISLEETRNVLKSLVRSCPVKMTIENLEKDYKTTMGHPIPFRQFGFRTIDQFLDSISDTILLTRGRIPVVSVVSSEKTQHMDNLKSIRKNIRVNESYFTPPVQRLSQYKPSQNTLKFENFAANKNINPIIISNSNIENESSVKLNKEHYIESESSRKCTTEDAVPDFKEDHDIFLLDFPINSVKFRYKIKRLEIPTELKAGDVFPIFVTEVHNPYKFWFHIAKPNNELDEMMRELQNFYRNSEQHLLMKSSSIIPGQICAALYEETWHRAEILGILNDGRVRVCFFDYGTVFKVSAKYIQYLPMEFAELSKQTLRGCLSHIRPAGLRWTRDATYSFLDSVYDKLIYAKITEILKDEQVMRLVLTDTSQEEDFQINNSLILKGHAKLHNQQTYKLLDKLYYPPFEMLENGEYPSFDEIGALLAQDIDYEEKVYNNIICDVFAKKCSLEEYIQKLTSYHIKRKD